MFVEQIAEFTTGTGNIKPFGQVRIAAESHFPSTIGGMSAPFGVPLPTSLEGPIDGVINLANAKGRVVGSITVQGDSWGQFHYQERRSGTSTDIFDTPLPHGRVIARRTGTLTFPEGEPTLIINSPFNTSSPPVPVPFTLTLS
jgi:hypothetical protein